MPGIREYVPANTGRHGVHTGGEHASYLQLPVQAAPDHDRGTTMTTSLSTTAVPTAVLDGEDHDGTIEATSCAPPGGPCR